MDIYIIYEIYLLESQIDKVINLLAGLDFGAVTAIWDRNEGSGSGLAITPKNTGVQFGNALSD